ncbi:helix-turn-helix domain-containing protein [Streptomyces sp. NBC_01142]|uniref:helix-turn-helix domain-containing protein n=1 Tax=Streptomyces sp. NBC_01142 TaxID=2975865 RepID=UPI002257EB5D|nr:helix-turn-helix domain-containing protein [Streptomyces sp. NBC_01142]MCX4823591.1 helix-turn-helix domain-containing protein [Streptomyces sp. NBC_01142]
MTATQFSAPVSARAETDPHAGVIHVRHRHDSGFTVVGNHLAQHRELSAVAIGIGVHIQSLPDGSRVGIAQLVERFPEGEVRIGRALRELEAAGYLERRRERVAGGRVVTRTTWYEKPGAPPVAAQVPAEPGPVPAPVRTEAPRPEPGDPLAAGLLAGLRRQDPRLLLSERDVRRLAPAVRIWLDRGVGPAQVARTLTGDLPAGIIRRPAGLLAHRLTQWLPPVLPAAPASAAPPDPFQTCDGCERAFRAPEPGRCSDCPPATRAA